MPAKDSEAGGISIAPTLDANITDSVRSTGPLVSKRVFFLSIQVIINAIIIGLIAKVLIATISLITNLAFYGTLSIEETSPAGNQLGVWVIAIPVIGSLIIGVMARWGSAAIRGHGIPEAMEQVLTNESRIKPIITLLKPLSAAISIGTGGPFGAEGPIISTGGAFGSLAGQIMRITPNERKIMLTAGATSGMAAIFGTPIAAVLLAIELLLFEFSPRSIIPVALACVTGTAMHFVLFSDAPVFPMPAIPEPTYQAIICYVLLGAIIGVIAAGVTKSVYWIEDMFEKLPIHWMWWPALGAIAVGVVGYFAPYTLGVGYSNITELLSGNASLQLVLGLCLLKFISWAVSLGSGTSGGTLAPLLTIGGATGVGLGMIVLALFPESNINLPTCALIGMASMFAGAARALLTSIVFAFESTMEPHGLLPLLGACTASYFVSFFMMKSTIITEKIQRRGVVTPEAYEPDVMKSIRVEKIMEKDFSIANTQDTVIEAKQRLHNNSSKNLIVYNEDSIFAGIAFRDSLYQADKEDVISEIMEKRVPYVYPNSKLSLAIELMARYKVDFLPVLTKENKQKVIGVLTSQTIFAAYHNHKTAHNEYQRAISIRRRGYKLIVHGKQLLDKRA